MTKSTVTSNRLTGRGEHENNNQTGKNYPAHIQSYHNCWESFAGMNNQEQAKLCLVLEQRTNILHTKMVILKQEMFTDKTAIFVKMVVFGY